MEPFRKPGSKVYTYEFQFNGQRIRESSGTRNLALARTIMRNRRTELEEGRAGIVRTPPPGFFSTEAATFMERRKIAMEFGTLGKKTYKIDECALKHLEPVFGKKLLTMITDKDIVKYQQARLDENAAAKSINLEMGTLRAILVRGKQWDRLKDKVGTTGSLRQLQLSFGLAVRNACPLHRGPFWHDQDASVEACQFRSAVSDMGKG